MRPCKNLKNNNEFRKVSVNTMNLSNEYASLFDSLCMTSPLISGFWFLPTKRPDDVHFVSCSFANNGDDGCIWGASVADTKGNVFTAHEKTQVEACISATQKFLDSMKNKA